VLFPQLEGKCQGITRKDGARSAFFPISCVVLCIVCVDCVVLCIVCVACVVLCIVCVACVVLCIVCV
jgi:hypothetical protein